MCPLYSINVAAIEDAADHVDGASTQTKDDIGSRHQFEDTADECEICQTYERQHSIIAPSAFAMSYRDQIPSSFRANAAAPQIAGTSLPAASDKCEQSRLNATLILAIIAGVMAIALASTGIQTTTPSDAAIQSHFALLTNRIEKLESDNIAMRMEISRLVDLVYRRADVDGGRPTNNAPASSAQARQRDGGKRAAGKRVWLGDGPLDEPVTLDGGKRHKHQAICNGVDASQSSTGDLFADYNAKKCEHMRTEAKSTRGRDATTPTNDANRTPELMSVVASFASKADNDFTFGRLVIDPSGQIPLQSVQNRSDDFGSEKRSRKYAKDDRKSRKVRNEQHTTKGEYGKSPTHVTGDRPFKDFAADDRTKGNNVERSKYQQKQQRKRKYESVAADDDARRNVVEDSASDWYAKMMKNREELRGKFPNAFDEQNWYLDRGNERERVRTKGGKPPKQRYVGA